MADASSRLKELLGRDRTDLPELAALLDGLSHRDRVEAIRSLSGVKPQKKLWDLASAKPRVTVEQLVPPDAKPLEEVIFHGKNSLPAFKHFEKRFCRPPRELGKNELWGYNQNDIIWLIGPGYFVCHDDASGAAIDYRRVPPQSVPGWPQVRPNDRGVSRLVYKNMIDHLRRVSKDVFIGSATKNAKEMNSYFVLSRER